MRRGVSDLFPAGISSEIHSGIHHSMKRLKLRAPVSSGECIDTSTRKCKM